MYEDQPYYEEDALPSYPNNMMTYPPTHSEELRERVIATIEAKRQMREIQPLDYHTRIAWGTAVASAGIASLVEYELLNHTWASSVPVMGMFFAMIGGGVAWTVTNILSSTGFKLVDSFLRDVDAKKADEAILEEEYPQETISEAEQGQAVNRMPMRIDQRESGKGRGASSVARHIHSIEEKERQNGYTNRDSTQFTYRETDPSVAHLQKRQAPQPQDWRTVAQARFSSGLFRLERGKLVTIPEDVSDVHLMRLFEMRWKRQLETVSLRQLDSIGISRSKEPPNAQTLIAFLKKNRLVVDGGERKPLRWTPLGMSIFPHRGAPLGKISGANSTAATTTTTATTNPTPTTGRVGE